MESTPSKQEVLSWLEEVLRSEQHSPFFTDVGSIPRDEGFIEFQKLPGWEPIIINLVNELVLVAPDFKVVQVKEKFGGLRFYVNLHLDDDDPLFDFKRGVADAIVSAAEAKSSETCMTCGEPGSIRIAAGGTTWVTCLCGSCAISVRLHDNKEHPYATVEAAIDRAFPVSLPGSGLKRRQAASLEVDQKTKERNSNLEWIDERIESRLRILTFLRSPVSDG